MDNCLNCGIELQGRKGAKFCSPKCRVTFSRKQSFVTDNVTVSEPAVTDNFEFYTQSVDRVTDAGTVTGETTPKKTAKYYYDVPLGAIPVIKKGWPEQGNLNGREYFLWWKNNWATQDDQDKPGYGKPKILNPLTVHDNVKLEMGGASSRKWGA